MPIFSKSLLKTLFCDLTIKSQIDFIFYIDAVLDLAEQLQCLVDETLSCLENMYLEEVAQSTPMKKIFLKTLQIFENTWSHFENILESPF